MNIEHAREIAQAMVQVDKYFDGEQPAPARVLADYLLEALEIVKELQDARRASAWRDFWRTVTLVAYTVCLNDLETMARSIELQKAHLRPVVVAASARLEALVRSGFCIPQAPNWHARHE